jgi:REP element-mobilizing transposase RayT
VYVHFVWATLNREKVISSDVEPLLYRAIAAACRKIKGMPLEIGGLEDHVHALVRMPGTVCNAEMAKAMKGSSSHLFNSVTNPGQLFRWQGGYGALSVSPKDLPAAREYIRNQKQRHAENRIEEEWERIETPDDNAVEDEQTIW